MIAKNRAQLKAWIKNMSSKVNVNENIILQNYMLERYVEGIGSSIIAKEPTAKRIKVPNGGTKWRESTIRGILKN